MKAVSINKPGEIEIINVPVPEIGPYQVRVKTEVACLCNSTDGKLVSGHFPGVDKYPLLLGHESVGIVEEMGNKVRNFKIGDRVIGGLVFDCGDPTYSSGWGGFCEYTIANDHDAMVEDGVANEANGWFEVYEIQRTVPADIPVEEAVLMSTWREVYGSFDDFNLKGNDRILIYGAGPVGLSFVKFGKLLGIPYIGVVDPVEFKREKALEMGADEVFTLDDDLKKLFPGTLDSVIDAVGKPAITNASLELIKMGGSVCIYGVLSESSFTIEKEKAPYNFNLYVHQWPTRFREKAAMEPLSEWVRTGKLSASEFLSHKFKLEDIEAAFDEVKKGKAIKVLLQY